MSESTSRRPISVLLVDDSDTFRRAARLVVQSAPEFECTGESETGEGAVALALELRPELVLMDVNLPGIDGIEATRRIVDHDPATVVVLLSTYDVDNLPVSVEHSGAWCYVQKVRFGPQTLREVWTAATAR